MDKGQILERIKQLAMAVLPQGSSLWLYGSRARGRELGWELNAEISPHIYSKKQWQGWSFLPYYKNVEQDKIVLV